MDVGTLKVALLGAGLLLANALLISGIVDQQAARRERLAREADERSLTQELDQIPVQRPRGHRQEAPAGQFPQPDHRAPHQVVLQGLRSGVQVLRDLE